MPMLDIDRKVEIPYGVYLLMRFYAKYGRLS